MFANEDELRSSVCNLLLAVLLLLVNGLEIFFDARIIDFVFEQIKLYFIVKVHDFVHGMFHEKGVVGHF